jgi:hypothetical protein
MAGAEYRRSPGQVPRTSHGLASFATTTTPHSEFRNPQWAYSGSGFPFVSGASQMIPMPTR